VKIFDEYPEVDFVYGDLSIVNSEGKKTGQFKSLRSSLWRMLFSHPLPQPACFWRKSLLNTIPPFNIQNKTCMDGEYFAYIFSQHRLAYRLSEPLACFRIHSTSITGSQRFNKLYPDDRKRIEQNFFKNSEKILYFYLLMGRATKYLGLMFRPKFETFKT
jgi:hypothetical protein